MKMPWRRPARRFPTCPECGGGIWPSDHTCPEPEVLAEKVGSGGRTARLVRRNGRLFCECPYACWATYESCEFEELKP